MKHVSGSFGLVVLSVLAMALSACGDGDGGSSTGGQGGTTATGGQGGSTGGSGGATGGQGGMTGGTGGSTGGQGGSTGGCRASSECPEGEGCVGPEDSFCGVPPQEECLSNAECGAGNVCHSMADGCSPDGVGSRCGAPCTQDSECGDAKFVCGPGGSCAPAACDQTGAECLSSQTCDTGSIDPNAAPADRSNGCEKITCASDATCPSGGACVNGYCQTGLGACMPPAP